MASGIEVFKDKKGEWRWRVKSRNGKIVAQSEGYKRRKGAENGKLALMNIVMKEWGSVSNYTKWY